jgi:Cu+-exporting ATPase
MLGGAVPENQTRVSLINERGIEMNDTTVVRDPVCGMYLESASSAGHTEFKGKTHYFCGTKCKGKFDVNPEQYVGKSGTSPRIANAYFG